MASSSKIVFALDTLRAKALEAIDLRIATVVEQISHVIDEEAHDAAVHMWRSAQEFNLKTFVSRLDEFNLEDPVSDEELAALKTEPIPKPDLFQAARLEREYKALEKQRASIAAKSGALVPDADGNVALTTTQLSEFFGLD